MYPTRNCRTWIPAAAFALVLLGVTACDNTTTPGSDPEITSGVQGFGLREVTLDGTLATVHVIFIGREGEHFERRFGASYPVADWVAIATRIDMDVLLALPDNTPCDPAPCTGTEWLEVRQGGRAKRLTFPAGSSFTEIADLLEAVRSVRESVTQP